MSEELDIEEQLKGHHGTWMVYGLRLFLLLAAIALCLTAAVFYAGGFG